MWTRFWLCCAFFISGVTSLIFEVLWAKELGFELGASLYAASTVIAAFMAGLALGSAIAGCVQVGNPWRFYACLQLSIGLYGWLSLVLFRATPPLWQLLYSDVEGPLFLLVRFLGVFLLLMIPTTLMGMTLPLVLEALPGRTSFLYGLNTLGAVVGTMVGGYVLIPYLGLMWTSRAAATLDILLAASVLIWSPRSAGSQRQPRSPLSNGRAYLWIYAFSGALALALEVVWFRLLGNVLGSTVYTFTNILSVYLIGLSIGSVSAPLWHRAFGRRGPAVLQALLVPAILTPLFFLNTLPLFYARIFWVVGNIPAQWIVACILILPSTVFLGALFPLIVSALHSRNAELGVRQVSSWVYFANTIGGIVGSLLAGFILLPNLGATPTLFAVAAGNWLLGYLLTNLGGFDQKQRLVYFASGAVTVGLLVAAVPSPDVNVLSKSYFLTMRDKNALEQAQHGRDKSWVLYFREGLNGTIAVSANDLGNGSIGIKISGKPEASSDPSGNRHLLMLGQLPTLLAAHPEKVAVIGLGTGITAGHVLSHPSVQQLDLLEIEPAMLGASEYFHLLNGKPLSDSRTHLHFEDGRIYLQYTSEVYDVITSDPISPLIAGSANLYAREYYALAARHLKSDGIFCQWIQAAGLSLATYRGALATLRSEFPHVGVFLFGNDTVVVGSKSSLARPLAKLRERWLLPSVQHTLARFGVSDGADLMAGFIGADEAVDRFIGVTKLINTDDNAWLEHQMPIDHYTLANPVIADKLRETFAPTREAQFATLFGEPAPPFLDAMATKSQYETTAARARSALSLNDARELKEALQEVTAHADWPNYYAAGVELNKINLSSKEWQKVIDLARRLQQVSPAFAIAFRQEADAHQALGDTASASAALATGRLFNPQDSSLTAP